MGLSLGMSLLAISSFQIPHPMCVWFACAPNGAPTLSFLGPHDHNQDAWQGRQDLEKNKFGLFFIGVFV